MSRHRPVRGVTMLPTRVRRGGAAVVAVACLVAPAVLASGCGSDGRSADAACKVWEHEGIPLGLHLNREAGRINSSDDVLHAVGETLAAPGRVAAVLNDMADKVPKQHERAFHEVADAFKQALNAGASMLSNPLGGLGDAIANAANSEASWEEVDRFISDNCAPPPGT